MKVAVQAMCLSNVIRSDRVDDRSPANTLWWGDPKNQCCLQ